MPIQIPRISVNEQVPQDHAPRLETPQVDAVQPMARQTAALDQATTDVVRLHTELQHQQADTTATNKANEFLLWRKKRLYGDPETGWAGYTNMTGADPQKLYQEYDKEEKAKLNELSSPGANEDWSNETQTLVNRRLSRHYEESQLETLTQYAHQKRQWDDANDDGRVKLAQQSMYQASTYIDPTNATSFGMIDAKIAEIRNARISQGMRNGGAIESENGEAAYIGPDGTPKAMQLSPSVKATIQKEISDGLSNTIENLLNSGALDKASAMQEHYKDYLDGYVKSNLTKKFKDEEQDQRAWQLTKEYENKDPEQLNKLLDSEDPKVKSKVLARIHDNKRALDQMEQEKQNTFYRQLHDTAIQLKLANPSMQLSELQSTPEYKRLASRVSLSQLKAVDNLFAPPTKSKQEATDKMVNLFLGQDPSGKKITDLSQAEFTQYLSGLNQKDQEKYQKRFLDLKHPSNAQLEQQVRNFGKELHDQGVGTGDFTKLPNSNFLTASDQVKEQQWKKELLDSIADQPIMSPKERSDYVAKFIAAKKAGTAFQPKPTAPKFNGGTAETAPPKADAGNFYGSLTPAARMQWIMRYRQQYKTAPNESQLVDFINKNTSK